MATQPASPVSTLTDLLFDRVEEGLCLVAPDGSVLRANPAWLRCQGLSADEVVGAELIALFPEARDAARAMHACARAGHRVAIPPHRRRIEDREVWCEGSIEPVPMEGGTGLLVTIREAGGRRAGRAQGEPEQRGGSTPARAPSPERDLADLQLADVLDTQEVQAMMDELHELARMPMSVVDTRGKALVRVGWQEICTSFHRVHPETCKHCIESDTELTASVRAGEIRRHRCKNSMWDVATPILVGGHHLGSVFTGQFFFDDERVDYDLFRAQAARYGFDEHGYISALDAVPRLSRDRVDAGIAFLHKLAGILSRVGFSNIKLARTLAERESLTRSLERSNASLEAADRRKDEFLGMLSHELRNPLAPIRNSLYILDRVEPSGPQARKAREIVNRQVTHLTRIVDDLLDVTRIARGKIELRRGPVDLAALARRTADDHRSLMQDRGLELSVAVPPAPVVVDGDETRLAQVFGNLLHNASKFTPPGGQVTLAVARADGRATVEVRDTGVGIDPETLRTIFEPFVQAKQTLARSEGGLGLGLALVKGLVSMHGGEVTARSPGRDRGTEFVVTLPLAPRDAGARSGGAGERAPPARRRILVVDDNEDAAGTLADLLEMGGHDVVLAHDGPTAVALALTSRPDVVLCDIGLPGMDGYEVARQLRAAGATDVQLVAVSGYAQPEDVARATEAGFDAHVAKPPDPEQIARLLA